MEYMRCKYCIMFIHHKECISSVRPISVSSVHSRPTINPQMHICILYRLPQF